MPTYTYRCKKCDYMFDKFQKITDPPLTTCPQCGGELMRVITGGSGILFKGSGFYITDYKHKHSSGSSSPKAGTGKPGNKSSKKEE